MPIYVFEGKRGRVIELFFPAKDAPRIGDEITHDGRTFRRVPSCHFFQGAQNQKNKYPYLSNRLPRTIRGCELVRCPRSGRMKPMIKNAQHEREVAAINDLQKGGEGVEDTSNYDMTYEV
jgi:hypothetical protein